MSIIYDIEDYDRFRAELANVEKDGRRKKVYAKKPSGTLYRWRTAVAAVLITFFITAPFIHVGGHQFMLLNLLERRFVLFGVPFWPQDLWLLVLLFLLCVVSIVLMTATLGRIWCGWMCPQTVFLEMLFRKLEWWIEGPPASQLNLRKNGWTRERVLRGGTKHVLYILLSFLIANVFLAYLISSDTLLQYVADGPAAHMGIIVPLALFSLVFYAVFARFREQACVVVCPYGRYMSSLVDDSTLTVTYDDIRGEPRGKRKQRDAMGDCVDCHQCVTVCPTGIDIRNGIQLECVQCTACIDACNDVMRKTKQPEGLIRYMSLDVIHNKRKGWITPRIIAYAAVWVVLVAVVSVLFAMRTPLDFAVLRQEGTTWIRTSGGIANIYRFEVTNRTNEAGHFEVRVVRPRNAVGSLIGMSDSLRAFQQTNGRYIVTVPESTNPTSVKLQMLLNGTVQAVEEVRFLTPTQRLTQ